MLTNLGHPIVSPSVQTEDHTLKGTTEGSLMMWAGLSNKG